MLLAKVFTPNHLPHSSPSPSPHTHTNSMNRTFSSFAAVCVKKFSALMETINYMNWSWQPKKLSYNISSSTFVIIIMRVSAETFHYLHTLLSVCDGKLFIHSLSLFVSIVKSRGKPAYRKIRAATMRREECEVFFFFDLNRVTITTTTSG